jgi:hypothetical protein
MYSQRGGTKAICKSGLVVKGLALKVFHDHNPVRYDTISDGEAVKVSSHVV